MLKIILISVLLIFVYRMHIFFCFFRNYLKSQTVSSMSLPTNMLIRQQHAYCFFAVLRSNTLIRPTLSFGSQEYQKLTQRNTWELSLTRSFAGDLITPTLSKHAKIPYLLSKETFQKPHFLLKINVTLL